MDVSVIIPTFNRPALLKKTLARVLAQTAPPREIIVVDNGTNDDSLAMVEATYGSAIACVKVASEGVQAARNAGIERAKGAWIAMLDDDDVWHTDYLERVAPASDDGRATIIYSDFRKFIDSDGSAEAYSKTNFELAPEGYWDEIPRPVEGADWSFVGSFPAERLLRFVAFYPSAMVIRRDFANSIGGFNRDIFGIKSEDIEFTARALLSGRLAIIWAPLMDYRIHGANSCAADWVSQAIGRWKIFEYMYARAGYGSERLYRALRDDLPKRRARMFDQAWRHSRFDAADEIRPLLAQEDWTFARRIRLAVRAAPQPLRSAVMHCRHLLIEGRVS
ncbi:MAG: glycosyltransferase family 2 protein [Sphingomonas sp.]